MKIPKIIAKPCRNGAKVLAIACLPAAFVVQVIINEVIEPVTQKLHRFLAKEDEYMYKGFHRPVKDESVDLNTNVFPPLGK